MPAPVSLTPPTSSFSFFRYISRLTLSLKLQTSAPDFHFLFVCFFSSLLGRVCTGVGSSLIENSPTH